MKSFSTLFVQKLFQVSLVTASIFTALKSQSQVSQICTDPSNIIYGLTSNGVIMEINANTGASGATIKNSSYSGMAASQANGLALNVFNGRFYYFKRNVTSATQQFVSFNPATNTVTVLANSTCTDEVHTGCINLTGTGYYTVDVDGNFNYYNIITNTWTFITNNIRDQNNNNVRTIIQNQSAGDMAMDGLGNLWLITSSNSNYGLYKFPAPLPTTPVAQLNVTRVINPTTTTPTGRSFAGIALKPNGEILMATKNDNRLYRLQTTNTLSFIGTLATNDVGNDLTSCAFPSYLLPVTWKSFDAKVTSGNTVSLKWDVIQENCAGFYVQHSINGSDWQDLDFIPAQTDGGLIKSYSYTHINSNEGKQYYRIKEVDIDKKENFSAIRTVDLNNEFGFASLWPNPVTDQLRIALPANNSNSSGKAEIFDLSGQLLTEKKLYGSNNTIAVGQLKKGTYLVRIQTNNGLIYNQKIIKQ